MLDTTLLRSPSIPPMWLNSGQVLSDVTSDIAIALFRIRRGSAVSSVGL